MVRVLRRQVRRGAALTTDSASAVRDPYYLALHESAGQFRRESRGRLLFRGADRLSYLHGLLTNDIAALTAGTGCYAALLTPQGRMITDLRVFELGEVALVDLEREVTPTVHEHFERFVITEDVTIEDATATLAQIGVYGPHAAAAIAAANEIVGGADGRMDSRSLGVLPMHSNLRLPATASTVARSDDIGVSGFDVFVPLDRVDPFETALSESGAVTIPSPAVEATRIEAGVPRFLVDMDTTTIPLEAGIEARAISMTKGCYVGQEVIIRVLHRGSGRVAKKLVRLQSASPLASGPLRKDGRDVGRITSATASPKFGGFVALGYVHRDLALAGTELDGGVRVTGH